MDVNQIEEKLSAYFDEPRTAYQLCADTGLGFSTMLTYLKILEAADKVKRVKSAKKTLWMRKARNNAPGLAREKMGVAPNAPSVSSDESDESDESDVEA